MKKRNKAFKAISSIIIIIIIIILCGLFFTYEEYFAPRTPVTSINSNIEVNPLEMALKLIPNNINLSLSGIKTSSKIELTESELTDLAILAIQKNQEAKNIIDGLKFVINNNDISLYVEFKYFGLPFEAKINFSCLTQNGQAAIHFESGKIGFISLPSKLLFKYLKSNEFITVDSANENILLNIKELNNITVNKFSINGNKLDIGFDATFKLF